MPITRFFGSIFQFFICHDCCSCIFVECQSGFPYNASHTFFNLLIMCHPNNWIIKYTNFCCERTQTQISFSFQIISTLSFVSVLRTITHWLSICTPNMDLLFSNVLLIHPQRIFNCIWSWWLSMMLCKKLYMGRILLVTVMNIYIIVYIN